MFARVVFRSHSRNLCRWERRRFTSYQSQVEDEIPRVKYLRPVIWSVAAVGLIYFNAATWEVTRDMKRNGIVTKQGISSTKKIPFEWIEAERSLQARAELGRRENANVSIYGLTSTEGAKKLWNSLTSVERAAWTATGLNITLFLSTKLYPPLEASLYHLPVWNRNWTLLTSMFGHGGTLHLFLNMYVLNNFALPVATSNTFQGSAAHSVAFYLSSGILSCLAFHLQSAVRPIFKFTPCLGASGAIYAMIGVFGMSYPDAQLGIILLPFSFPAQEALYGFAAFELWGTLFGTRLRLAHISHLTGLLIGIGYVQYDAGVHVWKKLKRFIYEAAIKSKQQAK